MLVTTEKELRLRQPLLASLVIAALWGVFNGGPTHAQVRLKFPEQTEGGPVYARIERPFLIHTDEWAAVLFYRDPACVPEDFNLLDMVDFNFPRVFGCPLTIEGFEMRETPDTNGFPKLVFTRGTGAVPVWFVQWSELEAAMVDDVLTLGELRAMGSRQTGYANFFEETLDLSETGQTLRLVMVARGALLDGRSFQFHYTFTRDSVRQIKISFGD